MPLLKIHREFEPPLALKDSIKCFWYDRTDFDSEPTDFKVVPDGYAEIIFYFGSSCSIYDNGILQPLASPFIMGLLNQPAVLNTKNRFEIIGVRCYPWMVFNLLGMPPGKSGVQVLDHPVAALQPAVAEYVTAGRISKAVALVQEYFINVQLPTADATLLKAGMAMGRANGTLPVSKVAAAANATVRTLERKFKQSAGHTVKDVSGLMRFEQVRNRLWLDPACSLAGLAYELGYTDQAHLSREFKRYSGTTPAAFARNAKEGRPI